MCPAVFAVRPEEFYQGVDDPVLSGDQSLAQASGTESPDIELSDIRIFRRSITSPIALLRIKVLILLYKFRRVLVSPGKYLAVI